MDVINKDPLFYKIFRPLITVVFRIIYRPTYVGVENIPKKGKVIIAGNHTNNLDCLLILSSTKRVVHGLAKKELFTSKAGYFVKHLGSIPVDRKNHTGNPLGIAEDFLKRGMLVGVFPEGTINRSEDVILPFKIGAVKMANDTNSEIVPFVIPCMVAVRDVNIIKLIAIDDPRVSHNGLCIFSETPGGSSIFSFSFLIGGIILGARKK